MSVATIFALLAAIKLALELFAAILKVNHFVKYGIFVNGTCEIMRLGFTMASLKLLGTCANLNSKNTVEF